MGLDRQAAVEARDRLLSADRAEIGAPVRRSDVMALLQQLPGALELQRLELHGTGQNVYQTPAGDIRIPPDAIAVLRQANIELVRA